MDLFQKITSKTVLLTPNRRLSAVILKQYMKWQTENGQRCWQTLDSLPLYPSWLERMWRQFTARDMSENLILLTTNQERILWEKILRDAPENESLLQVTDTAKLAKSAWETLKRWQVKLNESSLNLTEDSRAFLNWADQFQSICKKHNWLDQNSLADILIEKIKHKIIMPPEHIVLVGFTDIAPQYQYLLKACEQVGSQIDHYETPSRNISSHKISLIDTETEIHTMAKWAKSLLNTSQSIGCVIPKLETVRDQVYQIFANVFNSSEFNISAGKSLIAYPVIYDALAFLNLNLQSIPLSIFSHILRSPFVGDAESEQYKRAQFDSRLRYSNNTTVSLRYLLDPTSRYNIQNACPLFAKRLKKLDEEVKIHQSKVLPISEWVPIFLKQLNHLGWPGERSLNSHEYQVIQNSWLPLLNEYIAFDNVLENQTYKQALHYLTCLIHNTVFQPESPEASVHILGLLEAAEIPFEHTWIMGLDDTTWPSRPKPNPFIPLRLQKLLNMPNASAERELLYSQQLTKQLEHSATHIIFSYPTQCDDNELRPSALLKNYKEISLEELTLSSYTSSAERMYQSQKLELLQDNKAPTVNVEKEIYGGVKIFKSQAECPFKAFAELRLHARKIEETTLGLRKLDRGNLLHKALELIWMELQDSSTLSLKSDIELKDLIKTSSATALKDTIELHNTDNTRYLALELQRLENLIWDWLQIEKMRSPFKVAALEHSISAKIGEITANFRVDRIDELLTETIGAKQLIIDYKTGKDINKNNWFGERIDEPQLPIYSIIHSLDTAGIAFAKINPNKMEMIGVSKYPLHMQSVHLLSAVKQADALLWDEQMQIWQKNLTQLSQDFFEGKAEVNPKNPNLTCRLCGLQPLCRIHELKYFDENHDDEELY